MSTMMSQILKAMNSPKTQKSKYVENEISFSSNKKIPSLCYKKAIIWYKLVF